MAFPTEQETYHRLRWDPRFEVGRCSVVVSRRPSGTQRLAFLDLDTNVVPWHRIVEFWIDDELAWSRPQRIDRLDELAGRGPVAPAAPTVVAPRGKTLKVVTWNLLFDLYDAANLRSGERWDDALGRLAKLDADVIALVEVTRPMWRRILAKPWLRDYHASHVVDAPELAPYGQVVLSRFPIRATRTLQLTRDKRAVFVTLEVGAQAVGVAVVHLTSNLKAGAPEIRAAQLAAVEAELDGDPWIITGDFNAPPEELPVADSIDAWRAIHGEAPGYTFDVARNALTAAVSRSGVSARYDRIHARGLDVIGCALVGDDGVGKSGLPPSDHFGVVAELALPPEIALLPPTPRFALAIVPPLDAWGPIQRIRCAADRNWAKWPPHVTLCHPFVDSARAIAAVAELAAGVEPFELALDHVEQFGRLAVLVPSRGEAVEVLHAAIVARLPQLVRDRAFRPHLTLARDGERVEATARWMVDRLVVLEQRDERYVPIRELALGRRGVTAIAPPAIVESPIVARVRALLPGATVTPFGSAVYAPEHAADLDLLVDGDASALGFRTVGSGRLRGTIDGTVVDVALATDERVAAGVTDARALRDHLLAHGRRDAFLAAWPEVRRLVHARGLGHNGLGYFGSFGWAMLLAIPLVHDAELCGVAPARAFEAWLRWLTTLRPHARLGFDAIRDDDPAQLYLAAPTPPSRNIARHLTPGTAATLFAELRRPSLVDLADAPPAGDTLVIAGTDEAQRGRYDGSARGLIVELEAAVGPVRVWGRFDGGWAHRITVPDAASARPIIEAWLARTFADDRPELLVATLGARLR